MSSLTTDYSKYSAYGFIVIGAYSQNNSYTTPTTSDLSSWASYYSITYPVVTDTGGTVDGKFDPTSNSRPTYVLIEPGMIVNSIGGSSSYPSDSEIEALLPTSYP